ncbi:hypothetical protein F511_39140 [Dorcoceras hygrometricum]|uniref:Dystroglycan-like n=1 Tax=Dorcoceras hygrometricum TaxID=472368 RepID=A0A2Z7D5Y6_9LAMI|nr:hypothetical protein F511_39140 [Dorcoceras hygrometricum]
MASFAVNALQVNFESVLSMEDAGMVSMSRILEKSGLRGFLGILGSVFEEALNQFFANASVIAGKIVSTVTKRKMVITQDVFSEIFHFPTEGMVSFSGLLAQAVAAMKEMFSVTDIPFMTSNKKKDMKVEYRPLHDIVAKSLSSKIGSFDVVTTERFEIIVAISTGLKINWVHFLFKTLVGMVSLPGNSLQVLNNKSVLTYMKKNQAAPQAGETRSDDDERPLAKLMEAIPAGQVSKRKSVTAQSSSESKALELQSEIKNKHRTKRPKLVKPILVELEQSASKDLPLPVQTTTELKRPRFH